MTLKELSEKLNELIKDGYGDCEVISEVDDFFYHFIEDVDIIPANGKHWEYSIENYDRIVLITDW